MSNSVMNQLMGWTMNENSFRSKEENDDEEGFEVSGQEAGADTDVEQ